MLTDTRLGYMNIKAHNYNKMTEEEISVVLKKLEADPAFVTTPAYRANTSLFPNNSISFVDAHLTYLKLHPKLDPNHYLANLRLMTRKR